MAADIAFIDVLLNDGPGSNVVGGRIFPNLRPQKNVFPAIMIRMNDVDPSDTKDGVSTLDQEFIGVFIYARTYSEIFDLATKTRTALDRYSGTNKGVVVQSSQYQDTSTFNSKIDNAPLFTQEDEYKVRVIRS